MSADSTPSSSGVGSNIAASRRRLYIANSQQVFASREAIWHVLKDKIYHPEKYVGCRDVHSEDGKDSDGTPYVDRVMTVGPPERSDKMHERITWDEAKGIVTFRGRNDPDKESIVYHFVEQKEGVDVITFIFDFRFKEHVPQAKIDGLREMLNSGAPTVVTKTIGFIHEKEADLKKAAL